MATTSPDNIWTPDAGDDYALTTDLAAMADTIQDAFTARPKNYRTGITNAQRIALSGGDLFEGLRVHTSDTRQDWLYTNSAWINERGLFLATQSNAQALSAGWNQVIGAYGTPSANDLGTWTGGALTLTRGGFFLINANAAFSSPVGNVQFQITKNSTSTDTAATILRTVINSTASAASLSGAVVLSAGDVIRFFVNSNIANNLSTGIGGETKLMIKNIGNA